MMNFESILTTILAAVLTKSASLRVGNYEISVNEASGAPAHLSLQSALVAVGAALTGHTGTIQTGNIVITIGALNAAAATQAA